jgi:hypothetical protein
MASTRFAENVRSDLVLHVLLKVGVSQINRHGSLSAISASGDWLSIASRSCFAGIPMGRLDILR